MPKRTKRKPVMARLFETEEAGQQWIDRISRGNPYGYEYEIEAEWVTNFWKEKYVPGLYRVSLYERND